MSALEHVYTAAVHLVQGAAPVLAVGDGKLARGMRGRRESVARIERWAAESRDPARPLFWFHAPSVGEGLQARAVIEALREAEPGALVAYTYFSPSAVSFAASAPAEIADYLPLDLPGPVTRLFDALRPAVIAFTKTEVWPNVTREAERRGTPVVLLSATLPAASSRLREPARRFLAPAHQRLRRIGAISEADGARFEAFGVAPERIAVMGDARFDQVWKRVQRPMADSALLASLAEGACLTMVAGSTWPADEERIVAGFAKVAGRASGRAVRLIIAPHEPNEEHLAGLGRRLLAAGLPFALLSDEAAMAARPPVVVVDRVGILGDLYRLAAIAYVGGGFGNDGLHSVLEPAAFGAPVIFGPNHSNSREAGELVAAGGAREARDERGLVEAITLWIDDMEARREAGAIARRYVEAGRGAARRGAEIVLELVSR